MQDTNLPSVAALVQMNKTILITGAAKRIGRDIALAFSDLGWNIIIHYNSSKKEADELASQSNSTNPDSAKTVQGNLDIAEDVTRIINKVIDMYPSIDLLVNNASTFYPTPIEEISEIRNKVKNTIPKPVSSVIDGAITIKTVLDKVFIKNRKEKKKKENKNGK